MTYLIARAVQTCVAMPSQWNAWTPEGQYLYLRYRHGRGTVHAFPSEDVGAWEGYPEGAVASFEHGDHLDGVIAFEEFCRRAGLVLAANAEVVNFEAYFDNMIDAYGLGEHR